MKIIKNYIVVKKFINVPDDKNYESKSLELGIMGDCFNTYAEAKEYAMSLREKHKEVSFGEVFYTDSQEPIEGEKLNVKYFLTIEEIYTVVCNIETTTNYYAVHMNYFYDKDIDKKVNKDTIMDFLGGHSYVSVRDMKNDQDVILNTRQITAVEL